MPDSVFIEGLLAKAESSYGVDPTPSNTTDAVRLADRLWSSMQIRQEWENDRDDTVSGTLLPVLPAKPRGRVVEYTLQVEPQPKGSAYSAVGDLFGFTALMRAGGHSANLVTSGVDFAPVSAAIESATLYAYGNTNVYKITGCRHRVRMIAEAGRLLRFAFEGQGLLATDPATASLPSITYLAPEPPPVVAATLAIGGWSPVFQSCELDFGQQVALIPSGNAADGIASISIVLHRPMLRVTVEAPAIGTYDPYTIRKSRTSQTITATFGSGAGSAVDIQSTTGYLVNIRHADVEGKTGYELEYRLTAASIRFD